MAMGMFKRVKDWARLRYGQVRRLFEALPSAEEIIASTDAAAQVALEFGDRIAALEPQDSRLLSALIASASLLDFVAPVAGIGGDKERALIAKVREIGRYIGLVDERTDAFWHSIGRQVLVRYIERSKALRAGA